MFRSTAAAVGSFRQLASSSTTPRAVSACQGTTVSSMPESSSSQLQQQQQQQRRWNFQVFLGRRLDRSTGKQRYDDWDYLVHRFKEPMTGSGANLLQRHLRAKEHIKPTEQNRRTNSAKRYRRSKKHVEDLTAYIQFVHQDNTIGQDSSGQKKK